jgi:hypothetical protein
VVKVEELGASLSAHQALHAEARAEAQRLQEHAHSLEAALMVGASKRRLALIAMYMV